MDDFNINVLSEAKNEYSSRLITILNPLLIEGIKSIFNEACLLCEENSEENKYLMTFQNFLTRVPKWNSTIINEESQRILTKSECPYLEDLLTCVHITQLKILTSIRVSQKQKKIDLDIPKVSTFIHKCYILFARKLYTNIYLFEKGILPLSFQKNMRELELLCRESIFEVIRDSMPIDKILRAYIDETVDEEIIEETVEKVMTPEEEKELEKEKEKEKEKEETKEETIIEKLSSNDEIKEKEIEKPYKKEEIKINVDTETLLKNNDIDEKLEELEKEMNNNLLDKIDVNAPIFANQPKENKLSFNDKDSVLDMGTNKESIIEAPKTIERLEEISKVNDAKRKAEEAEEEEDDDDKLQIFDGDNVSLDITDIHDIDKQKKLKPDPILNDIEVLI
jgi:hypothetical protein